MLGLPLNDAINCVTYNPALIRKASHEIGALAEGSTADFAIPDRRKEPFVVSDAKGQRLEIPEALLPIFVNKDGKN